MSMKNLGEKMARKRKDLGMTQTCFAEKLSVTRQTVSRWEAGSVLPDIDKVTDIADLLGVSCDYLLNDEITEEYVPNIKEPVSRLLRESEGKTVRFQFFDGDGDMDLFNTDCVIIDFEGNWMRVAANTKKGRMEKLIPISSVRSIEYTGEAE